MMPCFHSVLGAGFFGWAEAQKVEKSCEDFHCKSGGQICGLDEVM
jgi:hypothetical protein